MFFDWTSKSNRRQSSDRSEESSIDRRVFWWSWEETLQWLKTLQWRVQIEVWIRALFATIGLQIIDSYFGFFFGFFLIFFLQFIQKLRFKYQIKREREKTISLSYLNLEPLCVHLLQNIRIFYKPKINLVLRSLPNFPDLSVWASEGLRLVIIRGVQANERSNDEERKNSVFWYFLVC